MFVIVALGMIGYGVIHSLLAGTGTKTFIRHRIGERRYYGLYRAGYNLFAIVTLSPILGLVVFWPGTTVWHVSGAAQWLLMAIQVIGLIGLTASLMQIDLGQFLGTTQLKTYLEGGSLPLATEPLQYHGVYKLVRHPLYLFSLMVIWPMGTMTESFLAFNIFATFYLLIGSLFEERKLVAAYGDEYRHYQAQTPSIIPFWKRLRER